MNTNINEMPHVLRAGLYERVSTDEQSKFGFSIRTQMDALEDYAEQNGLKIIKHYTDDGVSGGKPAFKRPEMARLLQDIKAGKLDIVLFTRLDRWFRNVPEYFKVQEVLDAARVQWKAIWEDYDTTSSSGRLAVTIFLAIAQNEREKGAERVKAVLENKRKNREACFGGSAEPFGYRKQKDENGVTRLVKDPDNEQACADFWRVLVDYSNLNKAIRQMQNVYGIKKDWKSWKRISQCDFYSGEHRGVSNFCEPYVTPDEFRKFQERDKVKHAPSGSVYLFRCLINCPCCGGRMCGDTTIKQYGTYKNYRCKNRARGCENHMTLAEAKVEKQLLAHLAEYIEAEIAKVEIEAVAQKQKPKAVVNVKALKERQRRLTVAYMAGNIPDEQYLREDTELKALIKKAEADVPPPPRDVTDIRRLLNGDFPSLYLSLSEEDKQRFWQSLLREIVIDKDKNVVDVIFR